jgi:hypothetical protein
MATTDARTGFRLPWSSDPRNPNDSSDEPGHGHDGWPSADLGDASSAGSNETAETPTAEVAAKKAVRQKPSKFLADLTKAMQAAAEAAREETLARFQAEAKSHIEAIHARSADDAAGLRRQADDDVAAIREWSKNEIARIREETETRITARKGDLEHEIEAHAARIERRIEQVQGTVDGFEAEMARFFERLLAEEDPTHFAAMAENLPEPPPFVDIDSPIDVEPVRPAAEEPVAETVDETETVGEAMTEEPIPAEGTSWGEPEGATAGETVAADVAADGDVAPETSVDGPVADGFESESPADDPRLAALALTPDSAAAAEAEAFASLDGAEDGEEIPTIADEAIAARLSGLLPGADEGITAATATTQVVVSGLVSVASIASFKRHLARIEGVQSVGVTSGPEGEFIFAATHHPSVSLRDAVPSLPSFQARVTSAEDGVVNVVAHDPEAED